MIAGHFAVPSPGEGTPTACAGCGASDTACARKLGLSGRSCCTGCTHIMVTRMEPR